MRHLLHTFFDGSATQAIAALIDDDSNKLSADDWQRLAEMIERRPQAPTRPSQPSALKKAAADAGFECQRADDIWEDHAVVQDIVNLIARARVVICDCSDKNANVFYEIGIAHALGKEVLLIAQAEKDVPFDLRHLRHVPYLPNREGLRALSKAVTARLQTVLNQKGVR